jgi:hypothetical protein
MLYQKGLSLTLFSKHVLKCSFSVFCQWKNPVKKEFLYRISDMRSFYKILHWLGLFLQMVKFKYRQQAYFHLPEIDKVMKTGKKWQA